MRNLFSPQKSPFLLDSFASFDLLPLPRRKRIISGVITIPYIYSRDTNNSHALLRGGGEKGGGVGWSMITPSYYLDAVELLCPMRLAERRDNAVLGFLPIRITAAIVRPPEDIAEGRRKLLEDRHFRSAHRFVPVIMSSHRFRGWSILPAPLPPCIMGDDALITATSWQRSAFETVFRISRTREEEHSS